MRILCDFITNKYRNSRGILSSTLKLGYSFVFSVFRADSECPPFSSIRAEPGNLPNDESSKLEPLATGEIAREPKKAAADAIIESG